MSSDTPSPKSAEAWLAEQGVERQPIRVKAPPSSGAPARTGPTDTTPPATPPGQDAAAPTDDLGDAVSKAVAFIRRSTAMHPAAEGRLREKLQGRDTPEPAIRLALERARKEGLVDDERLVQVLAEERRAKGHAAARIRTDLRRRGFDDELIAEALASTEREDPEAVAFDVAARKAASYGHLDAEAAFRRLVGYLARRGHGQGLSRKVARQVIFDDREQDRIAGH